MKYILSHDIGTTGVKSCLFDREMRLIADRYRTHRTFYHGAMTALQRPDDWWDSISCSTREILEETGIPPESVAGICVDGHMNGCIPLDRNGKLLMDETFMWADFRSTEEAGFIRDRIGFKSFYEITGGGLDLQIYPAAKILWMKRNLEDVYRKTHAFLGTKDYINYRLTGCFVTDYSEGSNYGLMDLRKKRWSGDLCGTLDLDCSKLPPLVGSCDIIGKLTEVAAKACGLVSGIPVVTGGGDVPCASVGAGSVREGTPYLNLGSASWVSDTVPAGSWKPDPVNRPFVLCHVVEDYYCTQLVNYGGGICYQWIVDLLAGADESQDQDEVRRHLYSGFEKWAADSGSSSNGLMFLPYLRGGGAPDFNEKARGALIGLSMEHGAFDMMHAVQEGVAYNIRRMIPLLFNQAAVPDELRIIGGGARSDAWCRTIADITDSKVTRPGTLQMATARGAAIVGGVGLGLLENFNVPDVGTTSSCCFEPNCDRKNHHDRMYGTFERLIESMNPYYGPLLEPDGAEE